jgi:hypothetical protein
MMGWVRKVKVAHTPARSSPALVSRCASHRAVFRRPSRASSQRLPTARRPPFRPYFLRPVLVVAPIPADRCSPPSSQRPSPACSQTSASRRTPAMPCHRSHPPCSRALLYTRQIAPPPSIRVIEIFSDRLNTKSRPEKIPHNHGASGA